VKQPSPQTIAVLPFHDISGTTGDSWAIGITDAIITRLTSLHNLAVRPTTSVLKYAKETPDPAEAAKALRVESILEGTYQRSSGVIRVTVQLIDSRTGTTKWAQRYDLHSADNDVSERGHLLGGGAALVIIGVALIALVPAKLLGERASAAVA
jgi:TolB-like protein